MVRGGLHGHPPGDLAHRGEQRQPPVRGLHRLIGDRVDAPVEEKLGEPAVGGQVQVGEQLLAGPEPVVLFRDGLLDLDDQVSGGERPGRGAGNPGAGRGVLIVGKPAAGSGAGLYHDVVAVVGQLGDAVGLHRDPALLVLDLLRHTNHQSGHARSPHSGADRTARMANPPPANLRDAPHHAGCAAIICRQLTLSIE